MPISPILPPCDPDIVYCSRAMKRDAQTVADWDFERIIPCHGVCLPRNRISIAHSDFMVFRMSSIRTETKPGVQHTSTTSSESCATVSIFVWNRGGEMFQLYSAYIVSAVFVYIFQVS